MADISELKVQITLTLGELKDVVALLNFADETMRAADMESYKLVEEFSAMYFETMEQLNDGVFEGFEPE